MTECPRWRLIAPHYLKVPTLPDGTRTEWEHNETNRINGRAARKLFVVPLLLNPEEPSDWNSPEGIIVTQPADGARLVPNDYIFEGDPTPDMEPLNDAAQEITDAVKLRPHPINSLPINGAMSPEETTFMQNMMAEFARGMGAAAQPQTQSVSRAEYDELKAKLDTLLAAQAKPEPAVARRA